MNTNNDLPDFPRHGDDHLLKMVTVLWSNKIWIVLAAIAFGVCGLLAGKIETPQYEAQALVQLETRSTGVQLSTDIGEMLAPDSEAITEIEIIKSKLVLSKVVEALQLDVIAHPKQLPVVGNLISRLRLPRPEWDWLESYGWNSDSIAISRLQIPSEWHDASLIITKSGATTYLIDLPGGYTLNGIVGEPVNQREPAFSITLSELSGNIGTEYIVKRVPERNAVGKIRSGLQVVENPRGSGILRLIMVSESAGTSEAIVAAVVESYVAQNIGRSAEEAERSLSFLEQQIPLVQSQLRDAESELNAFRLESESIDLNYEAQSILERSVFLDAQLSTLALEESELSRRYTTNHPVYSALLDKKRRLESEKDSLAESVQSLPNTQQEILRKTRDVEVSQQIYLQLLNKSQELRVMKAGTVGNVRLIDEAAGNPIPVLPNISSMMTLAAMTGAFLCGAFCILRNHLHKEIDTPDDLSKLNVPVLAIVPLSTSQQRFNRKNELTLLANHKPNEVAIEAIRGLRTNLRSSLFDRDNKIVSITGPAPQVGKSFISANLACLMARTGARVLVIDADMRRGNLGKHFAIPADLAGLSQTLSGDRKLDNVMYKINLETMQIINSQTSRNARLKAELINVDLGLPETITDEYAEGTAANAIVKNEEKSSSTQQRKKEYHITVIPRGLGISNPSELLMSERFPELLEYASQHFDTIIIDTPPVLAATDAMIVSKYVDINLMVVRHGATGIHEAEEVARTFSNNRIRLNGIVLNGYDSHRGKYGKYGVQYGYQYNYV